MNPVLKINKISIGTPPKVILEDTELSLNPGTITGIWGRTGSGKSTFMKALLPVFSIGSDQLKKIIEFANSGSVDNWFSKIGYVEQWPRNNIISRSVEDEITFSLQSEGKTRSEALEIISPYVRLYSIADLLERDPTRISLGECHKVALVEAISRKVELLMLDEPTSHLDPGSVSVLTENLKSWVDQNPQSIVLIASHDISFLKHVSHLIYGIQDRQLINLSNYNHESEALVSTYEPSSTDQTKKILEVNNLSFRRNGRTVFKNLNFVMNRGERKIIMGSNGSGKSSFFNIVSGIYHKFYFKRNISGDVRICGIDSDSVGQMTPNRIYLALQDPSDHILSNTVADEFSLNKHYWTGKLEFREFEDCGLPEIFRDWDINPDATTDSLSYGQTKLLSLAPVFQIQPSLLLADEPFTGLDRDLQILMMKQFDKLSSNGVAICIATHDREVCRAFDGEIIDMDNYTGDMNKVG